MRFVRFCVLALSMLTLSLASVGCGSGGGGVDLADLPHELSRTVCEKQFDCCPQESAAEFDSVDDCTTQTQLFTSLLIAVVQESENAGRARYDSAGAADCLDQWRALACAELESDNSECLDFIVPLVDVGGACDQDFECINGYCEGANNDQLGSCVAMPQLGDTCNGECASGSYCDFDTGVCLSPQADGSACFGDEECQSSYCDFDTGVCGQPVACT